MGPQMLHSQDPGTRLKKAWEIFSADSQLIHAIASLQVVDAETGQVVFSRNAQVGLAPASTQKIITSITALDILGEDFRFATSFFTDGTIVDGILNGNIIIKGSGDPTLGSPRWASTTGQSFWKALDAALAAKGIRQVNGGIYADDRNWDPQTTPGGWIWDDMGNYYGAGAAMLNWRENQYDLSLRSGTQPGDPVIINSFSPIPYHLTLKNELVTGRKGTGDNAWIYLAPYSTAGYIRGTIPAGESAFRVSGSFPDPTMQFLSTVDEHLRTKGIRSTGFARLADTDVTVHEDAMQRLFISYSPPLDSVIYWFNQKSINLYGECLVRTMAASVDFGREKEADPRRVRTAENPRPYNASRGITIIRNWWKAKGIDESELAIEDGCGLSPQNRITTHAQVQILRYARTRLWFPAFLKALPEYNGMKMKSGTIKNVKGFCGYQKSAAGKTYVFSFLVNNYHGASSALVSKMYRVLDELK